MKTFAAWFKAAREAKNFSQAELAARVDMTVRSISRIETGEGLPHKSNLRHLAQELGYFPEVVVAAAFRKAPLPPLGGKSEYELTLPPLLSDRVRRLAHKSGRDPESYLERLLDAAELINRDGGNHPSHKIIDPQTTPPAESRPSVRARKPG